jgi:hypothetical protein
MFRRGADLTILIRSVARYAVRKALTRPAW